MRIGSLFIEKGVGTMPTALWTGRVPFGVGADLSCLGSSQTWFDQALTIMKVHHINTMVPLSHFECIPSTSRRGRTPEDAILGTGGGRRRDLGTAAA